MKGDPGMLCQLMARAQRGDQQAYGEVLRASEIWLRRYFAGKIASACADDLVQETLISVHRKRASFDSTRPFLPWLAAIARYRWVDQLRRTYRAAEESLDADRHSGGDAEEDQAVAARISLDRLLGLLPDRQARVIRLVKIDGHSISEAGARTGQSEPLVKINIYRGLQMLTKMIESDP